MKKTVLKKYAHLIAKMGINIQEGQEVIINADLDQPEFVKLVAEECYGLGASKVTVEWNYQPLTLVNVNSQKKETLARIEKWELEKLKHSVETVPCRIYIESQDPDGLSGMDQKKYAWARQKRYKKIKKYRDALENRDQWCIAAVPGEKWAMKLFPQLSKKQAVEKLWELILFTSRVSEDPVQTWQEHDRDLIQRCAYLNELGIESLHYTSSNGTDLTVGMIPNAVFRGGGETSLQGIFFNPNIPTEECFISPMRGQAEGIVHATKPLSYQSQLIENFWIRFSQGKAVEWHAEKNNSLLTEMLNMDEGASYLGECALVPFNSPIQQSGILFYNTLFDENAACHLALGAGFADTIENFENYTLDECRKMGINDSMIHVDFMIGNRDLSITAKCRNGREVPVFRQGTWAF